MKIDKIFKREDGSQVMITVTMYIDLYRHNNECVVYKTSIDIREKGKKKWISIYNENAYSWRLLSMEDRKTANRNKELEYVTLEEIQETALELWQQAKPTFTP